jgi:hypothetical protein
MTTYKFVISDLKAKIQDGELSNVIETIHWRYQATDGENTADVYGSVGLDAPEAESFIAADQLTKETVISWLEAKLDVDALKAGLDAQLELMANPTHTSITLTDGTN